MKRIFPLLLAMLSIWMLAGCNASAANTTTDAAEAPSAVTTLPPETTQATTAPTLPPETEPPLETGSAVTVDGTLLPGGSVLSEGVLFVKVSEFLSCLESERAIPAEITTMSYREETYLPLEDTCAAMGISLFYDESLDHFYCTTVAGDWDAASGYDVPVLMYHGVTDDTWGVVELFVSPADLEEQLIYLSENGYQTIFFEDLRHIEDYEKPVILTFDDGYRDNYEYLFPLLQKYQAKATIFLISDNIDTKEKSLTSAQVREMAASGLVSFQSHTATHPKLNEVDQEQLSQELNRSKLAITRLTGKEPFVLCYPYGKYDQTVRELTGELYKFGIAMSGGLYTTGTDVTCIPRYYVRRDTTIWEFEQEVQGN